MLLDLLDRFRGAFEYDWWTRFGFGPDDIGRVMSWATAYRMVEILKEDGSSQLGAKLAGWQYTATRAELTLRDLYDLQHKSKAKKGHTPKPYPRPWDAPRRVIGRGTSLTISEFQAIRASMVESAPTPQTRDSRGRFTKAK